MKANRIFLLVIICCFASNINAQVNRVPSQDKNGLQNFYFNKPNPLSLSKPLVFLTPIPKLQPGIQQAQFHFDLLNVTEKDKYYQSSLDNMICLTPNKPINDNLNAMPIYKIQDLSKMPNAFPKSDMITIK